VGIKTIEEIVSFRELSPEIPSTTYASHGMYYHPARFIPQVVSWFLNTYTREGDWVVDPFAGGGTLAVECLIKNRNAVCLDLNPLIENLLVAKTCIVDNYSKLAEFENRVVNSSQPYRPKWSRIDYWYHPEILKIMERMWGAYYESPSPLGLLALFKTSRRFSYADDEVPKIFGSRRKRKEIDEQIVVSDFKNMIREYFRKSLQKLFNDSLEFAKYYKGGKYIAKGGIDLPYYELDCEIDHLITSPPYGRAHEYIRSFKLELAWLGYDDRQITDLIGKEIPYRKLTPDIDAVRIESKTYELYRRKIDAKLLRDYDCYFKSVIKGLEKVLSKVTGYAAIFVGNATYGGIEPPYQDIFKEHFVNKGFVEERILIDLIKSRKLFRGRRNLSPNGIEREYLLVLKAP
jgi:DNA modification methylase